MPQAKADRATRAVLKGTYWILIKNRADLTPEEAAKLQAALAMAPTLRTASLLTEEFRTVCEKVRDRDQACRFPQAWSWRADAGSRRLHALVRPGLAQVVRMAKERQAAYKCVPL